MSSDFYRNALAETKEKYKEKPTDRLLQQKLFYYQKLGWPKESISSLNEFLEKHGLDKYIVELFLQYHLQNEDYASLVDLLDKWEFYHGLDEKLARYRILAHVKVNGANETFKLLNDYISRFKSDDSYAFVTSQSLEIGDTLNAAQFASSLSQSDPNHKLILDFYVPHLLKEGKNQDLLVLIEKIKPGFDRDYYWSQALYTIDSVNSAKHLLKAHHKVDAHQKLSEWYRMEKKYDSSILYIDKMMSVDSSRSVYHLKSDVLNERGWFNSSYAILEKLIRTDSTDSIAVRKAGILARKIAYLRRLKEEEEEIPIPEIKPKKLIE